MKILLVQDYLRSGGTERQSVLLARLFKKSGHAVSLLTFRPGGVLAPTAQGVPLESLQTFDTQMDWFAPGLRKAVTRQAPAVVLCMGRMANCYAGRIKAMLAKARIPAPVIGTMRTGKRLPWLFRRSLDQVDAVVANSEDSRRVLINDYRVAPTKISVIYNSLVFPSAPEANKNASAQRTEFRRHQGAAEGTCVLLCVAMFRPEKNQRELIEIAVSLPDELNWQLWLVGEGPAHAECVDMVRRAGLSDKVKFFGYQSEPSALYRAADIAVLTSLSESLSNFLVEAHAHGLASVAYDVSGVRECGGTVVPCGDRGEFRESLLKLANDSALRESLGSKLIQFAQENFSQERQAEKYLELFRKVIGEG